MEYRVTHNERPKEPRAIGPFYEWSAENNWTQYMSERDAQTFMQSSAIRELTFVAVDDYDNPLPQGYPLADGAAAPEDGLIVLVATATGPVRTIVYPHQLATTTKE